MIIRAEDLTKKFGDVIAVDNLNLEIKEGEIFSLLGVNGAGKTTIIRMLSCLSNPTSGTAVINDLDLNRNSDEIKKIIGLCPQETAVAFNLTVRENLEFIAAIYFKDKKTIENKATEVIKKLKLEEVENKKAKVLSGGFQRRLSIALGIISDPKILFLDEPTIGLDVIARRELWEIIKKLKINSTIILTTHYMDEAEKLSDRIGIIVKGKLKIIGSAMEIISESGEKNFEDAFVKMAQGDGE